MKELTLAQIDPNFAIPEKAAPKDLVYYDPAEEPFRVYGLILPNEEEDYYHRLPAAVAMATSEGVTNLAQHTAGGRIRFCTDSPYVVVRLSFPKASRFSHMPKTGGTGLDLYEKIDGDWRYVKTFVPPYDAETGFESIIRFPEQGMHEVTINMPSYNRVNKIQIGLSNTAEVKRAPDYRYEKPVVFYGSSITQGGCASRPGNAYTSLLCRSCDCNYINLGFSGNGKGETAMAEHIASLDMSVFVMDYDHNSGTEELRAKHTPFFKIVREAQPQLPIIILPRPRYYLKKDDMVRREIVYKTYQEAIKAGDKNVYFIGGEKLMELAKGEGSVDYTHPNDFGFHSMARALEEVLNEIMG